MPNFAEYALAASLKKPAGYLHLGWFSISFPNLIVIGIIFLLFTVPLILGSVIVRTRRVTGQESKEEPGAPEFIGRWFHIINSLLVATFVMAFISGIIMASRGLSWIYSSNVSRYVHAVHFWAVQFFFVTVILHFMVNFWRAAWRGHAFKMWVSGVIGFFLSMFTAFTGGLLASNLNSQWIGLQSKNIFNSLGLGTLFNTLNVGQMLTLHMIFPFIVAGVSVWHVALVRGLRVGAASKKFEDSQVYDDRE